MKKNTFSIILSICIFLVSCLQQNQKHITTQSDDPIANEENDRDEKENAFELHGIIDPGMNNMVAFALQTPAHWSMQQSFTRIWNGSSPINQVHIRITSPDKKSAIEFLPYTPYYYSDGLMARQMRQAATNLGMPQRLQRFEMPPAQPLDYIKQILLPQLAQSGLQIQPNGENIVGNQQESENTMASTAYIDGLLNNQTKVRVDCVVRLTTTNVNGEIYYQWNANPSVTTTDADLSQTYSFVSHARKSFLSNPSWEQQNSQLVQKGNRVNNDINQKNAAIVKDYQDHTSKIINETYADRNKSQDQRNEAFGDMIKGESKYENTTTGERMKLTDQYNHVYQDKQGNFYGTNSSLSNNDFSWEELQKVETKHY